MIKTPEEIIKNIAELKEKINELDILKQKTLQEGYIKHEDCCIDVCNTINHLIKNIENKIKEIKNIQKTGIKGINKQENIFKERLNELEKMSHALREKGICNCKI